MAFRSLPDDVVRLVADNLGLNDVGSTMQTAHCFHAILPKKFCDVARTNIRNTGETVLLWAALHDREYTFTALLERGADASIRDKGGQTVLHHLAMRGSRHMVTLLLQHVLEIDNRNERGETPVLCAVQAGNEDVVDQLLHTGADPSTSTIPRPEDMARRQLEISRTSTVVLRGPRRSKELFIRRKPRVGRNGETFKKPLHFAAQQGRKSIVALLLDAGADASATTYHEQTALHYCS